MEGRTVDWGLQSSLDWDLPSNPSVVFLWITKSMVSSSFSKSHRCAIHHFFSMASPSCVSLLPGTSQHQWERDKGPFLSLYVCRPFTPRSRHRKLWRNQEVEEEGETRRHWDKQRSVPNPFDFLPSSKPFLVVSLYLSHMPTVHLLFLCDSSSPWPLLLFSMGRASCCDKVGVKKGPWTPEEDRKLIDYIQKHGQGSWRTLPKKAGTGVEIKRRPS